ncbi:neuronal acetylcholine receptor subunit alpha-7-like [Bradysia coprophila]|uniref:neuronal acetylcholine receptor subunit alpha-7-like n=1 Tax=Bradysia coprophila TaxID=38358 RepID=UPI00187DA165|nr:neuronal acetylcholine receptor subunit alpha-7-like [Bradysia coprophila]
MTNLFYFCVLAAFVPFAYGNNEYSGMVRGSAKMRSEIRKSLFGDYDKLNIPDNPNVKFGLTLNNIDVDEEKQTLEADIWLKMTWTDDRLKWDNESTGVSVLRIGPDEIWKPDITLYNSANPGEMMTCTNAMPLIFYSGTALWVPPCHISAYCNMTLEEYPLGEQSCKLKFGSWVYDGFTMNIELDGKAKADTSNFMGNRWDITKNVATRKDSYYPCCKEPYPSINYNLSFKRKTNRNVCL